MSKSEFYDRANWHLRSSLSGAKGQFDAMLAEHSAKGRLQSGATLIRAVKIWAACSDQAVAEVLAEFGGRIEVRGRRWAQAMSAVLAAIDDHRETAEADMHGVLRTAQPQGGMEGSAMAAVRQRLDDAAENMRQRVIAFRDGWTSPRPRPWNERHPVAFAIIMAIIGAAIALAGQGALTRFVTPPPNAAHPKKRCCGPERGRSRTMLKGIAIPRLSAAACCAAVHSASPLSLHRR